ncbi:four helix bundle protein [Patescibacteria group bacterium]|nr:four helix bundle protein [Patescibacteria group bacterium]MBU4141982.1 four helix bundle protein [Patescibacteria group bacterium]MBU4338349.1 four helix bundle protein [Patescibacteria group bacterium]MBU4580576.1 four helix bundle protein [Patescibacteria group bacterium]
MALGKLEIYKNALELSKIGWEIYGQMSYENKKIIGSQFIRAMDSIGANIAEGYGRFHYLDRVKFYYNSRGSLFESKHWSLLLKDRQVINEKKFNDLIEKLNTLHKKLNSHIKILKEIKNNI